MSPLTAYFVRMIISLIFCLGLVSCKVENLTPDPGLNNQETITATTTPTLQTTEPTLTASATPKATATIAPSLTPSITPANTLVLLPTLEPDAALHLVLDLYETNGDCNLPCLWGWIIPGQTKWSEAEQFLASFADDIELVLNSGKQQVYSVHFSVPSDLRLEETLLARIRVKDGLVEEVFLGQAYLLSRLLAENGPPSEIWISAKASSTIDPKGRFSIVLHWESRGILAVYDGETEKTNPLNICMDEIIQQEPALWIWNPVTPRTAEEVGGEYLFVVAPTESQHSFFELEEVSNIGIEAFFEIYKNPENLDSCFQMPDPDIP